MAIPCPGILCARHYLTAQPLRFSFCRGRFLAVERTPAQADPEALPWIAPGLVDLQVNGFAGIDFQQAPPSAAQADALADQLSAAGISRFLPTFITDRWDAMLDRLAAWRRLREQHPALRALIAGWHLEGPYLSAQPGFCGAHPPEFMLNPHPAHLEALRGAAGTDPVLLTIAPERLNAESAIQYARRLGFRVALGHTNASRPELEAAMNAGATLFTHLGNGCPQALDRHDNILWRVLDLAARLPLHLSLIPDGIHVSPALFRLIHRAVPRAQCLYVSDAMAGAGAPPGRYSLGRLQLEVGRDRVARQPGQTNFAGSALTPLEGIRVAAATLNEPWQQIWNAFSVHPAKAVGIDWGLQPGAPADFCLIEDPAASGCASPSDLRVRVFQAGQEVEQRLAHRRD